MKLCVLPRQLDDQLRTTITDAGASHLLVAFTRCAEQFRKPAPDMDKIMQISAEHGIQFVQSTPAK